MTASTSKEEIRIVQNGDPVLRGKAKIVLTKEIVSPKIQTVLSNMKEALSKQDDGIAIAAPQIGVPLRIFLVSIRLLQSQDKRYEKEKKDLIFINPQITKISKKSVEVEEGCLSVRWLYGKILRKEKVTIKAYNENGELFSRGASGLLAQIFQHEVDHLEGILFIDTAYNLEEIPPEKREGSQEK